MRKWLFESCGISHMDLSLLLDAKLDEKFKDLRIINLTKLENFVVVTSQLTIGCFFLLHTSIFVSYM